MARAASMRCTAGRRWRSARRRCRSDCRSRLIDPTRRRWSTTAGAAFCEQRPSGVKRMAAPLATKKEKRPPPCRCAPNDLDPEGSGGTAHLALGFPLVADLHTGRNTAVPGSFVRVKANVRIRRQTRQKTQLECSSAASLRRQQSAIWRHCGSIRFAAAQLAGVVTSSSRSSRRLSSPRP